MLEEGALVVGLADDMGQKDRPLLSPKAFEEFIAPAYKELIDMAHKRGAFFWLHSCGNITELLPTLVKCGLDVWQTLEPASGVDLAGVKERFGDKMTFAGAIDYSRTVPFGNPAEIDAHVRKVLKAGMPGGGYIAGPSHDIMDVPLASVIQARDLVKKLGVYPCRI
jgi:uroporphyrinogen decarboxylase